MSHKMSNKRATRKSNNHNRLNVHVIQMAFLNRPRQMIVRFWTEDMGLHVPNAKAVGYSILFDSDDRPDCVVSSKLYGTPRGAWDAAVEADKVKEYPTYDAALYGLADSIGFELGEELEA